MNRIENAFKSGKAFIGFLTACDPNMNATESFILEMEKAGADLVEIGIPFSDPIAEGPVIQEANIRALSVETTTDTVFELVDNVRRKTQIPLVFLTYYNPILHYGVDKFFNRCKNSGIDGIIIPDLPFEEKGEIAASAAENGVEIISLIAPTSQQRIQKIASQAGGFIYAVSSLGVTGIRSEIKTDLKAIIDTVKSVTNVPIAVGFGINTPDQAHKISRISDGVIVGSAIVKLIAQYGENASEYIYDYVKSMKEAIL